MIALKSPKRYDLSLHISELVQMVLLSLSIIALVVRITSQLSDTAV